MMSCLWILVFGSLIAMQGGKVAASEEDGADVTPAPAEDPDLDSAPSEDGSAEAGTPALAEDTASEEAGTTETPSSETEGQQSDPEPTDSAPDSAADPPSTEEPQTDPPVTADDSADDETDPPVTPADNSADDETDPPVTPADDSADDETDPPVTPENDSADDETDPPVTPADDSADDETEAPETDDSVDESVITEEGGRSIHAEGPAGNGLDLSDALDTEGQAENDQPTGDNNAHSAGAKAEPNDGNESKGSRSGTVAGVVASFGVAIIGAVTGYFAYLKKKLCFKAQGRDPERAKEENGAQSDPQVLSNLLKSS
ncbi:acidic repeat-containing protein isoform X2 [Colossoma macropomum]|uniref:acidic repeat-containing protein isoform X2 n=1 Tax=Colossoma macropomum TaxID=42526 RepID=UPI0018641E43|nr:acidic repeat-containing protein isoform X2 [Colossoma macropomum]